MDPSEAVEARARERVEALEHFRYGITDCHVTIDAPHRHHHQGQLYAVRLRIHVPGSEIVINHGSGADKHAHEDVYVALRDAFDAAERQLADFVRKRDHRTSPHAEPLIGHVTKHFGAEGYGFVETSDGLDVYFHEHSVVGQAFDALQVGDEVRVELTGLESTRGPQASTVRPTGRHHRHHG
jgi:cold shock CspA family protein/ribosome-associated translation inhibitor RaiA